MNNQVNEVKIIGAGLAGCEAAWILANAGVPVTVYEMKPKKFSPAHELETYGELVCSNSLKAKRLDSAAGLLKEEMRLFDSLCVEAAYACEVPAGGALAVDRHQFSAYITEKIESHPLITVCHEEVTAVPTEGNTIIASGPLTSEPLAESIRHLCGGALSFFDAAAPIITAESLDKEFTFCASRYDHEESGEGDYINCPMNREEYERFHEALITAETAPLHEFDKQDGKKKVYEGCMPIEVLAKRGKDSIRYGPMKPVGLRDPKTGHRPWAVLQLRKENADGSLLNLVGFQTNLKFGEQKRVFGMIPALHRAEFIRYGVMHRNTFLDSPRLLSSGFALKSNPNVFFAGQITGVEGYMESAASGMMAGINMLRRIRGKDKVPFSKTTMMGALSAYISDTSVVNFQPMGANFGILPVLETHIRDKRLRYQALAERAVQDMKQIKETVIDGDSFL